MKLFRNAGIKKMSRSKKSAVKFICIAVCLLLALLCSIPGFAAQDDGNELIVGGSLFGLKMQTKGVAVVGLDKVTTANGTSSPAYDAGIKISDAIISINGISVSTVKAVTSLIEKSNGKPTDISILRKGSVKNVKLTPALGKDGKYHIGI
jgi:predicted metalloprotease with PDZ domain